VRILVAGGTGFVGRNIVRSLLEGEHDVSVLTRNPSSVQSIPQLRGVEARVGDVTDPDALAGVMSDIDAVVGVVQLPNYPVELPRKGLTFDRFDRRGTENLLQEARRSGVSRYVYLSGAGADVASNETWYRAKGLAERAVEDSGLDFCILRPSWAYGPDDKALNRFVQIARISPVVPRLGTHVQRIQPVFVEDIGMAVRRMFEIEAAWGGTLEIGGPEVLTMDEVIRTMLEVIGRRRAIVPVPAWLAKAGTAPLLVLPKPPLSPGGVEFAIQDAVVNSSALEKVLDIHPMALRDGLARYLGA
jgi:uncharacterized protein YbjT (DUF2867 family)